MEGGPVPGAVDDRTTADLILAGASVFPATGAPAAVGSIAVGRGRILAVGEGADRLRGPDTEVLSLSGRLVVPGFQDAHIHPVWGGLARQRCDLHGREGRDAYRQVIAAYARSHPDRFWILGSGWSMPHFPGGTPSTADLDDLVPDRPVFLKNRDGHGAWVNSRALELAGIGRATPDPADGRIERDPATGEPSGTLHEGAMRLVERHVPGLRPAEMADALRDAQSYLHSLGITAWQDAWVTSAELTAYRDLAGRGELTARVAAALWWDRHRGDEQIEELSALREAGDLGRLRAGTVKVMLDGVAENFTAAMTAPYLDAHGRRTTNAGISFVDPAALARHVVRLDREGFQVHFHAIGDRAVRDALDAVAAALAANGRRDSRHHIAHVQVVHPRDLARFGRLHVAANIQPYWASAEPQMTELTIPFLGPERAALQYPFRSLLGGGARLAVGSDWSVSSPDPLHIIETAVNRVRPDHREREPFLPDERLDTAAVVAAYTAGSAYVNFLDGVAGTIEEGKQADLAVIDRDIFAPDAGPIADARVVLTMVGGEVVFERGRR